jgi:hypothetical protein
MDLDPGGPKHTNPDSQYRVLYYSKKTFFALSGLPDFLEYLADSHTNLPVKHSIIGHARELETTTMHVS